MELLKVLAKQGNLVPLVEKVRRSYLLLPAWYHVSSNSLRTPPLKWTGDVRRLNQCCFYVYRWAINCARSIMKRSCRSCCERTLVRALPPSLPPPRTQNYCLFSQFRMEVPPSKVYSPTISVHAKTWFSSWNPPHVTFKFWLIFYSLSPF